MDKLSNDIYTSNFNCSFNLIDFRSSHFNKRNTFIKGLKMFAVCYMCVEKHLMGVWHTCHPAIGGMTMFKQSYDETPIKGLNMDFKVKKQLFEWVKRGYPVLAQYIPAHEIRYQTIKYNIGPTQCQLQWNMMEPLLCLPVGAINIKTSDVVQFAADLIISEDTIPTYMRIQ